MYCRQVCDLVEVTVAILEMSLRIMLVWEVVYYVIVFFILGTGVLKGTVLGPNSKRFLDII